MRFDLLIKGGEVVDPGGGRSGRLDVAIKRNRIAAVDPDIPAESAFRVIDAAGQHVTPGLVDLHTHVNYGLGFYGIRPDPIAARSGVTTWLDVGSSGAYNFLGFREFIIEKARARIYALLNISSIGLTARTWELANPGYTDVDICCKIIDLNRDILLGVKVRIDSLTTSGQGLAPLHRAREAADRCELPLMTHIGSGPPEYRRRHRTNAPRRHPHPLLHRRDHAHRRGSRAICVKQSSAPGTPASSWTSATAPAPSPSRPPKR